MVSLDTFRNTGGWGGGASLFRGGGGAEGE